MKVGIFWYFDHAVHGAATGLAQGEEIDAFIDSPVNHVHYWKVIQREHPSLRHSEYFALPRGRVLYDKGHDRAVVYMDKVLFKAAIKLQISAFFDLLGRRAKFERDAHYTTDEDDLRTLFGH